MTPFVRSAYNYDLDEASVESQLTDFGPSKTKQEFKDETDINVIAAQFGLTGQMPVDVRMPMVGDFTEIEDYQGAMNAILRARHSFMQLPANVRERFNNDPQEFLMFCDDDRNLDEAKALGLVKTAPVPPSVPPPATPPNTTP